VITVKDNSHNHNYAGSSSAGGAATSANKVNSLLTFNNGGSGGNSGTTFDGSAARTISYNTIGAASPSSLANVTSSLNTHTTAPNPHSGSMSKTNPTGSGKLSIGDVNSFDSNVSNDGYAFGSSHAIKGEYGMAAGLRNSAGACQLAICHHSKYGSGSMSGTTGTAFVIGNGTDTT
jgi:hypothetical protein